MYERRSWGEYTVLHHRRTGAQSEALTKHLVLQPGGNISYQYHQHRSEVWTVIQGSGTLVLDGRVQPVAAGSVVEIPVGMKHTLRAAEELHIIEVQLGSPLVEEDIVRLAVSWEEIEALLRT